MKTIDHTVKGHIPRILVVDDDQDSALLSASALRRQGCHVDISTGQEDLDNKLLQDSYDFVLLDWMLGKDLTGQQFLDRAGNKIAKQTKMREKFGCSPQKVITHSVLDSNKVEMPDSRYFEHYDHWQKPIRYNDLTFKMQKLLMGI